jgi:oligopeptide transport system ATP-binding protein
MANSPVRTDGADPGKRMQDCLLEVRDLKMHFPVRKGILQRQVATVQAVDGVSFGVKRGETFGLVGESGCGKSTTGRAIVRLYDPTSGQVLFKNQDVGHASGSELLKLRRSLQMIFQDPYASLNPRMSIGNIIAEALDIHGLATGKARWERVEELLELVGLNPSFASRYPHEFSGGQRQRIGIARALAVEPEFIVCDEPVSALDVSIQAQIINLFEELQARLGLTFLFIAHDLSVVRHISNRVAVMYCGKLVELADRNAIYNSPLHPYTKALLSAVPVPHPRIEAQRKPIILQGDVPSVVKPPMGCRFHSRCQYAEADCAQADPPFREVQPEHWVACHHWDNLQSGHSQPMN